MRFRSRPTSLLGHPARAAGASLVELLVVIAISGVISTGMYSFFLATSQTYSDQAVNARMLQTATTAMSFITQDIRRAGTFWATPCALTLNAPLLVSATNGPPGRITVRVVLDDPTVRTEIATLPRAGQSQTSTTFGVLSTAGFQVNDGAFITDGVQCTWFTVTGVAGGANPGLQHVPANDLNSPSGANYTYPVATSLVYRVSVNQQITYALDTTDPKSSWLTRDMGSGPIRLVPDVESLTFSYVMNDGSAVSDPATITTAAQAANIRTVNVSLRVKADTRDPLLTGDGFRRHTLASTVKLRNLGS